jgi:hypothetical protein
MRLPRIFLAVITLVSILTGPVPAVLAGAQDTGELASCELPSPRGIPIEGTAALSIDLITNLAVVTFRTQARTPGNPAVVIRAMVGPDLGVSPMEYICQTLHGDTAEGGATLAEQILAAANLTGRTLMITKRGIFGCPVLPCDNPGPRADFDLVPGSDSIGAPTTTALGQVRLFAVRP